MLSVCVCSLYVERGKEHGRERVQYIIFYGRGGKKKGGGICLCYKGYAFIYGSGGLEWLEAGSHIGGKNFNKPRLTSPMHHA